MNITYIIVADGGEGVILKRHGMENKLEIIKNFYSQNSHKYNHDLGTDRPGRTFDSKGEGHHIVEPKITEHKKAKFELIKNIANEIKYYYKQSYFDELIIIAPPEALGQFKDQFTKYAQKVPINKTIEKDLNKLSHDEIIKHIDN